MLKEIISFSKEFLDYYDLNDLTMTNSSNRFTNPNVYDSIEKTWFITESYTQHLIRIIDNSPGTETYVYKPYNLNTYKDRLVSFLQNFIVEDYPELKGMSEEEAKDYIKWNSSDMYKEGEDGYSLWDELLDQDIVKNKISGDETEVLVD